jgi:hypothetical protein
VEAPQFGQNARPGLISALQLGQSVFCGASERPQPLQNVSPSSYGVLQFGQRNVPLAVDGTYCGVVGTYTGTDDGGAHCC